MTNILKFLKELVFGKKRREWNFPFALVEWSQASEELGLQGNRNKVITRYTLHPVYNTVQKRKFRYSEARVYTLEAIQKIPVFDKTLKEPKYPVYTKALPGEIEFSAR